MPDEHKDLPVFMIGGWYDLFSSSTTETYMALKKNIRGPVHLIIGPWIHGMQGRSHGQADFGPDAAVNMMPIRQAWYDRWLKGNEAGFGAERSRTPVRMFVMGSGDGHKTDSGMLYHGGCWRDAPDYPLAGRQTDKVLPAWRRQSGDVRADRTGEFNHLRVRSQQPRAHDRRLRTQARRS